MTRVYLRSAAAGAVVNLVLSSLQRQIISPSENETNVVVENFLSTAHPIAIALFLFLVVVAVPILEELFFRGLLWKLMSYAVRPSVVSIVVAVAFAFTHSPQNGIFLLPMALYLSHLRVEHDSMKPGMVFHIAFNTMGVLVPYLSGSFLGE